jgi:glycosyltransferase involved in cell wall biosynthesis
MNPKVSAIILSYNHEQFIYKALESVFLQDFNDYEIIIRDDASTDHSAEIISDFIETHEPLSKHVPIEFIKGTKNLGLVNSYNDALKKSIGDIIVGFAGDDISSPTRIKETVELLIKYNVDLVSCDAKLINDQGTVLENSMINSNSEFDQIGSGYMIDNHRIIKGLVVENLSVNLGGYGFSYQKKILPYPGFLPENALAEDHFISFLSIISNGALILNKPLLDYRIHDQSITGININIHKNLIVTKFLERKENNAKIILEYLKNYKYDYDQTLVFKCLNNEIFNYRFIINYCVNDFLSNILLVLKSTSNQYININKIIKYSFYLFIPFFIRKKIGLIYNLLINEKINHFSIENSLNN